VPCIVILVVLLYNIMMTELLGLEKSDFHSHLTGSLNPEEMLALAAACDRPDITLTHTGDRFAFDDPEVWAVGKELTSTVVGLSVAIDQITNDKTRDNVTYAEVTLNTSGMLRRGMSREGLIQTLAGSAEAASAGGLDLRYKFGVNRREGPDGVADVASVYLDCPEHLRSSVDLNGDERLFPTEQFVAPFRQLVRRGIRTSIHAGEFPDMEDSLVAALDAEPTRIAHVIAAAHRPDLQKRLASQGVVVELLPTSNLQLGGITTMADHPLKSLLDQGIPILLGTDDPGVFGNTMTQEYEMLARAGLSLTEITELNNAINDLRLKK